MRSMGTPYLGWACHSAWMGTPARVHGALLGLEKPMRPWHER